MSERDGAHLQDWGGGRYASKGVLGTGGLGSALLAVDRRLGREVVLKVPLLGGHLATELTIARQAWEMAVTAHLEHAGVVAVHDVGDSPGPYGVLSRVKGLSWDRLLASAGEAAFSRAALRQALSRLARLCDVVDALHRRGFVHRDLHPGNVLITPDNEITLIDLGNARPIVGAVLPAHLVELSEKSAVDACVGNPCFCAPEQCAYGDRGPWTPAVDVYGLGALLHFALFGVGPTDARGNSLEAVFRARSGTRTPPPRRDPTGGALQGLLDRCLDKEPERRPASARLVGDALRAFLQSGFWLDRRAVRAGEVVVKRGDVGDAAFVVTAGSLQVLGRKDTVTITAGAVFGEASLFSKKPRSATVVASTDVELLVVRREDLAPGAFEGLLGVLTDGLARKFADLARALSGEEEGEAAAVASPSSAASPSSSFVEDDLLVQVMLRDPDELPALVKKSRGWLSLPGARARAAGEKVFFQVLGDGEVLLEGMGDAVGVDDDGCLLVKVGGMIEPSASRWQELLK